MKNKFKIKISIIIIVLVIGVVYVSLIRPYEKRKSFCIGLISYNPPVQGWGSSEGYYKGWNSLPFKTYKEAVDNCIEQAKVFNL